MACAHAKFSGDVGVCLATSGPGRHPPAQRPLRRQARPPAGDGDRRPAGAISLGAQLPAGGRPGLAVQGRRERVRPEGDDARAGHPPDRPRGADRPRHALGDVRDRPQRRPGGGRRGAAARARRRLLRRPGAEAARRPARARPRPRGRGAQRRRARRDPRRPGRARGRRPRSSELAELLGAGVAKALNGRDVLPDDLPYVTGSIGLLGTKPSDVMMQGCDTLLMVGSSFPYSEWLPEPGQARGVQIDIDARMLGIRYPMEVNLAGDARDTLQALLPAARAQARPRLAGAARGRGRVAGGSCWRARPRSRPSRSTRSRSSTSSARGCPDGCIAHRRLRLGHELVGAAPALPPRHARRALRHARHDGPGACPTGWRPSSSTPTAR